MIIQEFINGVSRIDYPSYCFPPKFNNEHRIIHYVFRGDGSGDFEQRYNEADLEVVKDYIAHCQNQIEICKQYLHEKED